MPEDLDEPIILLHRDHVVRVLGAHPLEQHPPGASRVDGALTVHPLTRLRLTVAVSLVLHAGHPALVDRTLLLTER